MAQTNYTPLTWSIALLKRLNSPVNHQTVQAVLGWVNAEGGNWHNDAKFNPLNTTMPAPGAGNTGSQGNIKVYTSWNQGLDATVRTLKNGLYGGILGALKQGKSAGAVGSAITASPWGTGGLAARVISATKVPANLPNVQPVAQPVTAATSPAHTAGTPATTRTVTTDPNQAARGAAIRSFLFDKSIQPADFASQVAALQPVTTTIKTPTLKVPNANPQVQGQTPSVNSGGGGGYVNPFGSSLKAPGRIDEGIDPTIQGPIRAIGDAKIVNISHNFYKGQPYVVYQLTNGIHAGRYIYVSELITPTVKVGDRVKAGQQVAVGHGPIETGWAGGPAGGYMPQANRAQGGNYTEGKVTGPGQSFAALVKRLGADAAR